MKGWISSLTNSNLKINCQYGFRSQMSTSHALLNLVEGITSSIDEKKKSLLVCLLI